MSLFDFFLKDRPKVKQNQKVQEFKMFNGYEPKFTSFGGDIYESELIRAAINARATHISKLKFDIQGSAISTTRHSLFLSLTSMEIQAESSAHCHSELLLSNMERLLICVMNSDLVKRLPLN